MGKKILSDDEVLEILKLRDKFDRRGNPYYGVDVAITYGVSPSTISNIWTGRSHKDIKKKGGK